MPLLTEKEAKKYSFVNLINHLAHDRREDCFEFEVSRACEQRYDTAKRGGVLIPSDLMVQSIRASGLDTKTDAAGKYLVPTQLQPLIEVLRDQLLTNRLGCTILSGLRGDVAFPRQLTGSEVTWVQENPGSDVAQTDASFGLLSITPKTATSTTGFTRQLLNQTGGEVENMVRRDLFSAMAVGIDKAALVGTGLENQPCGLFNVDDVAVVEAGDNGAAPDFEAFCDMESEISVSNADVLGPMGYVVTPEIRKKCKLTPRLTGELMGPVWADNNTINGYPAFASNLLPKTLSKGTANGTLHGAAFGHWPSLIIGSWGPAIEIIADHFSKKKQGVVEVTSFLMADVAVRYPQAFAIVADFVVS